MRTRRCAGGPGGRNDPHAGEGGEEGGVVGEAAADRAGVGQRQDRRRGPPAPPRRRPRPASASSPGARSRKASRVRRWASASAMRSSSPLAAIRRREARERGGEALQQDGGEVPVLGGEALARPGRVMRLGVPAGREGAGEAVQARAGRRTAQDPDLQRRRARARRAARGRPSRSVRVGEERQRRGSGGSRRPPPRPRAGRGGRPRVVRERRAGRVLDGDAPAAELGRDPGGKAPVRGDRGRRSGRAPPGSPEARPRRPAPPRARPRPRRRQGPAAPSSAILARSPCGSSAQRSVVSAGRKASDTIRARMRGCRPSAPEHRHGASARP